MSSLPQDKALWMFPQQQVLPQARQHRHGPGTCASYLRSKTKIGSAGTVSSVHYPSSSFQWHIAGADTTHRWPTTTTTVTTVWLVPTRHRQPRCHICGNKTAHSRRQATRRVCYKWLFIFSVTSDLGAPDATNLHFSSTSIVSYSLSS